MAPSSLRARARPRLIDQDALRGAAVAGAFGLAWTQWGASGLPTTSSTSVRVIGIVVGVAIIARSLRYRRRAPAPSQSMFRSRAYQVTVLGEAVALLVGIVALAASGEPRYIVAWVAAVVGLHFIALARFGDLPYALGTEVLAAGVAGAVAGFAGAGTGTIEAISALLAAAGLFGAGIMTLVRFTPR